MARHHVFPVVCLVLAVASTGRGVGAESCCSSGDESSRPDRVVRDEAFSAVLQCDLGCGDGRSLTRTTDRVFRPLEHGLRPGDGSNGTSAPWGGTTGALEAWGRMVCLEEAVKACGDLEGVENSWLREMTSGEWKLTDRIPCPSARDTNRASHRRAEASEPILSPFDELSGAHREVGARSATGIVDLPEPEHGIVFDWPPDRPTARRVDQFEYWVDHAVSLRGVPDALTDPNRISRYLLENSGSSSESEYVLRMQSRHDIPPAKSCTTIIRGESCFGDCLEYPEGRPMEQYLATNKLGPENFGTFAVCGDHLVSFFSEHEMSEDSRKLYCESFVMSSLVAARAYALTCSSYRIRPDCSAVVSRFSTQPAE